jgi:hypothetical protein
MGRVQGWVLLIYRSTGKKVIRQEKIFLVRWSNNVRGVGEKLSIEIVRILN